MIKYTLILLSLAVLFSCGEGVVEVDNSSYEPKIVVEAYLIPNQKVSQIRIERNFPLNANLRRLPIVLGNADVVITDLDNNIAYPLTFVPDSGYFQYSGNDWLIAPGGKYRLDVSATVNEKPLVAYAETTVPSTGLEIVSINHDSLRYRQRNSSDELMDFLIDFQRSPSSDTYVVTVEALGGTRENFIYDNPFDDLSPEDLDDDDIRDYSFDYEWIIDTPLQPGITTVQLFWWQFWFYTEYRVVLFAADENYANFIQTYAEVEEEDGNFHAPVINIEGDGIGVFGAAATDTVFVRVIE